MNNYIVMQGHTYHEEKELGIYLVATTGSWRECSALLASYERSAKRRPNFSLC